MNHEQFNPPPPEAKAQGAAKKPWSAPRLLSVNFDDTLAAGPTAGFPNNADEGPHAIDPIYDPNVS